MRANLLLALLLITSFYGFSQEAVKKADSVKAGGLFLDVSAGVSFPLGAFASPDVKNEGSAANTGFLGQLNLDWIGKGGWGLGLQYTFQNNPVKSSVQNDTLYEMNMKEPIGSSSWTNHYLMAGVVFLKYFDRVYFEGKGLIGFILSSSPLFKTSDPDGQSVSNNKGTGLGYGIQFGAGYAVSKRVTIKGSIEYLGGTPKMHHQYTVQDTTGGKMTYTPVNMDMKKKVSTFLVKAGVVIKLSK